MGRTFKDHKDDRRDHKIHRISKHNKNAANNVLIREWEHDETIAGTDLDDFNYKDDLEGT